MTSLRSPGAGHCQGPAPSSHTGRRRDRDPGVRTPQEDKTRAPPPSPAAITSEVVVVLPRALGVWRAPLLCEQCSSPGFRALGVRTGEMKNEHNDQTSPIRRAHLLGGHCPPTHYDQTYSRPRRRAAHFRKTNKKRCQTNPPIRPGAIENAVCLPKTNPNKPKQTHHPTRRILFSVWGSRPRLGKM